MNGLFWSPRARRSRWIGRLRFALAAALLPTAVAAQTAVVPPAGLSLTEALALAQENNPDILQQRNDLDVAEWSLRAANGNLLPSANLNTNVGYTAAGQQRFGSVEFPEQPEAWSSSYGLNLSYQLNGSTILQPRVQKAQLRATERRITGAAANLDAQVAQQYLSVLQAQEQVAQAEREVARTAEHVKLAQARLDVGAGIPLDVRRAQVQAGQAQVRLLQAQNTLATSRLTLEQLIGTPLAPSTRLTSEFALFEPVWDAAALVQTALEANPNLRAARSSADAAKTGIRAAKSAYLPYLSFSAGISGYATRRGDVNAGFPFDYARQPWNAGFGVSLPLFTGFSRQLQVEQAQAQASDARFQVRAQELRLRTEVAAALQNLKTAYATAILQEQVRESAAEELRMARERFRFGAAGSVEVTDAETNLREAERAKIDAIYSFHKALAALEALVGRDLREPMPVVN